MKFMRILLVILSTSLLSAQSFGFFNPITDTTDRITVVYERVNGTWFETGSGSGVDVEFQMYLQSLVASIDADTELNCSNNVYISPPVSASDAMLWNHDIATSAPFPTYTTIGGFLGSGIGLICETVLAGSAEGACGLTLGTFGGGLGWLIDRYRAETNARPPLVCGDSLMAIETTCTSWTDSPQIGPRQIQTRSVSFTTVPGSCP